MVEHLSRVAKQFRRLDEEIATAVGLPAVSVVTQRAGAVNRFSIAAAAAVIAVGALGGVTVATKSLRAPATHSALPPAPDPVAAQPPQQVIAAPAPLPVTIGPMAIMEQALIQPDSHTRTGFPALIPSEPGQAIPTPAPMAAPANPAAAPMAAPANPAAAPMAAPANPAAAPMAVNRASPTVTPPLIEGHHNQPASVAPTTTPTTTPPPPATPPLTTAPPRMTAPSTTMARAVVPSTTTPLKP